MGKKTNLNWVAGFLPLTIVQGLLNANQPTPISFWGSLPSKIKSDRATLDPHCVYIESFGPYKIGPY